MGFDKYFDQAALLTNRSNRSYYNGSETAQMTGFYRFGRYMKFRNDPNALVREQAKFAQELDILTYTEGWAGVDLTGAVQEQISYPGVYVNHPKPCDPGWACDPKFFNREDQRSLVIAMGALKQKKALVQIFLKHVTRFGWYQNEQEFISPIIFGEYLRAGYMCGIKSLATSWPILFCIDLISLIGFLIQLIDLKKNPSDVDDDIMYLSMLQAKVAMPTPFSWLTRKLYKWFRPGGPLNAIVSKYSAETGNPPFAELYTDILEREL